MKVVEVFADVACPFAHAGLLRLHAERGARAASEPLIRVRAWPLELVNGHPHDGTALAPEIDALRAGAAPTLFVGFDAPRFPSSSLAAMAAEAAAYRQSTADGERFSLAVRHSLFEDGLDISDAEVVRGLCTSLGVPAPTDEDRAAVLHDLATGRALHVVGSPYFITGNGDFFCPSLSVRHDDAGYSVTVDPEGFSRFVDAAFG